MCAPMKLVAVLLVAFALIFVVGTTAQNTHELWYNDPAIDTLPIASQTMDRYALIPSPVTYSALTADPVDWRALQTYIDNNIPLGWNGPLVFDGESYLHEFYYLQTDPQARADAVNLLSEALNVVRAMREDALVGMYAMPQGTHPAASHQDYLNKNDPFRAIFVASTALFPSFYDHYPRSVHPFPIDENHVRNQTIWALQYMAAYCPPRARAYPFFSHRYAGNNKHNNIRIPEDEFKSHVSAAFDDDAQYNGVRASGLIFWHADIYNWNAQTPGAYQILQQELADSGFSTCEQYWANMITTVIGWYLDVLEN